MKIIIFLLTYLIVQTTSLKCLNGIATFTKADTTWATPAVSGLTSPQFNRIPPYIVVQPINSSEVQKILRCVATKNICASIKSGGHSYAGFSQSPNGLQIDMHKMKGVKISPQTQNGTFYLDIEPGANFQDIFGFLDKSKYKGFLIPGGYCPTVAAGGYYLGGGLGPFTREFGLGVDNILSMNLVLANGSDTLIVTETQYPRLWWALLGAGQSNFGIVTQYTVQIYNTTGRTYTYGEYCLENKTVEAIKENFKNFGAQIDNISEWLTMSWSLKKTTNLAMWGLCYLFYSSRGIHDTKTEVEQILGVSLNYTKLTVRDYPYLAQEHPGTFLTNFDTIWEMEQANGVVKGYGPWADSPDVTKSCVIKQLPEKVTNAIVDYWWHHMPNSIRHPNGPSCVLQGMVLATKRKDTKDTSFFWRDGNYASDGSCGYVEQSDYKASVKFAQGWVDLLTSVGQCPGGYVSFPFAPILKYGEFYFGSNYQNLTLIKEKWNPTGILSFPQAIKVKNQRICKKHPQWKYVPYAKKIVKDEL